MIDKSVCIYNVGVDCSGGECATCGWNKDKELSRVKVRYSIEKKIAEEQKPKKADNPYWERICKLSERQRAKGMQTYGLGLENNYADVFRRINHLQEELVDALMYCEWIKDKLREKG